MPKFVSTVLRCDSVVGSATVVVYLETMAKDHVGAMNDIVHTISEISGTITRDMLNENTQGQRHLVRFITRNFPGAVNSGIEI